MAFYKLNLNKKINKLFAKYLINKYDLFFYDFPLIFEKFLLALLLCRLF